MVFYRKYRPQNFEELIGQDHVKKTLLAAFSAGKLGHAYLFTGPRGSGKTSTARILAKIVNCERRATSDERREKTEDKSDASTLAASVATDIPCNKCSTCLSITDGSNLDLIEIDAASNRGIDDIRELREKIKLAPSSAKKKVYIIDEVHMLTTEAFNALLKTLEEPPAHVLFILATTEVQKLPTTILSRVQRFDFKLANLEEIKLALKNITDKEGVKVLDEIINLIAEVSEGSFRDAVKLLDQICSMGEEISLEQAQGILKANDFSEVSGFIEKLVAGDSKSGLVMIQSINEKGASIKEFTNSILRALRQMLLIKNGVAEVGDFDVGSKKLEVLWGLADKVEPGKLVLYLENFQKSLEQLKYTTISSLPIEVALIKSVSGIRNQESREAQMVDGRRLEDSTLKVENGRLNRESPSTLEKPSSIVDLPSSNEAIPSVESMQSSDDVLIITDKWTYILETIRPYNYSLEALLKQARVKNCDGVNVILEVPYSFHQRILEAPKSRTLLESVLADVLGKSVKVTTVIGKREVKASELANVEVAQDDEIVRLAAEIFNS